MPLAASLGRLNSGRPLVMARQTRRSHFALVERNCSIQGLRKLRPAQHSAATQSLSSQRGQADARVLELLIYARLIRCGCSYLQGDLVAFNCLIQSSKDGFKSVG
jgi:hypothetical protein